MKRAMPLAIALALGLAASAQAEPQVKPAVERVPDASGARPAAPSERAPGEGGERAGRTGSRSATPMDLEEGTPVVVLGTISSRPRNARVAVEQKMQVAVGPKKADYTLHFDDKTRFAGMNGEQIAKSDLQDKSWVRAEGMVMDDPRRVKVTSVQVIGGRDMKSLAGTPHFREGFARGYVMPTGRTSVRGFEQGTPVVLVGKVSSPPKGIQGEQKMQVAVGADKMDYTVHFKDAQLIGLFGQTIDEDGFDGGQWVRAEGAMMDDARRLKAERVQVISRDDLTFRRSAFSRPGYDFGYVMTTAGSRQTFPAAGSGPRLPGPMTLVGQVTDDTGPLGVTRKIQVRSAGNQWTLNVTEDAQVLDARGEKISVHEVDKGQWVRVTGWQTEDLRMRVVRVENLGAEETFKKGTFYRSEWPMGYVERMEGPGSGFEQGQVQGTVTSRNDAWDYVVIRDGSGREHRVYADTMRVQKDGRHVPLHEIQVGDRVTVEGHMMRLPAPRPGSDRQPDGEKPRKE